VKDRKTPSENTGGPRQRRRRQGWTPGQAHPAQLREYLRDESVALLAIRHLVQRHADGADPVFRTLLRKPGFSWSRDGEKLLRRDKKPFFDREPIPSANALPNFSAPVRPVRCQNSMRGLTWPFVDCLGG
jgi:hypothetical protein